MTGTLTTGQNGSTGFLPPLPAPKSGIDFCSDHRELRAFLDLQTQPVTFDIGNFLALAEAARVEAGCSHIRIYVVPGCHEGFRNTDSGHDAEHSRHRLSSIVLPALHSLPTCAGVSVLADRASALDLVPDDPSLLFPEDYSLERPTFGYTYTSLYKLADKGCDLQPLLAPQEKHSQVHNWLRRHRLQDAKTVTVTLRESGYQVDRNSNLSAWGEFCGFLTGEGYQPIILRDFDVMYSPVPDDLAGYPLCDVANWDLGFRLALYEHSELSFFVNNGPQVMCFFNKNIDFMVAKWITETVPVTSTAFRLGNRDRLGKDHSFLGHRQHIVWENDDFDVLVKNYRRFFGSLADDKRCDDTKV